MLILLQSILSFLVKAKLPRCVKEGRKTDGKVTTPPPQLFLYLVFETLFFPLFYFPVSSAPSASSSLYLPPSSPWQHAVFIEHTTVSFSRQTERERGGGGREGEIENTLLLKDKDLSTERLVYISVPDDTHISITDTQ